MGLLSIAFFAVILISCIYGCCCTGGESSENDGRSRTTDDAGQTSGQEQTNSNTNPVDYRSFDRPDHVWMIPGSAQFHPAPPKYEDLFPDGPPPEEEEQPREEDTAAAV